MKLRLLIRSCAVAIVAAVVCALEALSGAAAGGDPGGAVAAGDAAAAPATAVDAAASPAEPPPVLADAGASTSRVDRRRLRHVRRFGVPLLTDAGPPVDGGARDAVPSRFVAIRDGGIRLPVPPVAPPPPPPPPPPPVPTGPSTSSPVTDLGFNTCRKLPPGKRAVKVNLKPEVELPELVAWISSITCKAFVIPGHLSAGGKKITMVTQGAMTPKEAYGAFLSALDSVGLTVEHGPGYLKIIETSKAKSSSLPIYGFDGQLSTPP